MGFKIYIWPKPDLAQSHKCNGQSCTKFELCSCICSKYRTELQNHDWLCPLGKKFAIHSRTCHLQLMYQIWSQTLPSFHRQEVGPEIYTRSPATAEGPSDALCPLKSCQRLHNCMETPIWKDLQQVNDLEGHSRSSEFPLFDRLHITSY